MQTRSRAAASLQSCSLTRGAAAPLGISDGPVDDPNPIERQQSQSLNRKWTTTEVSLL